MSSTHSGAIEAQTPSSRTSIASDVRRASEAFDAVVWREASEPADHRGAGEVGEAGEPDADDAIREVGRQAPGTSLRIGLGSAAAGIDLLLRACPRPARSSDATPPSSSDETERIPIRMAIDPCAGRAQRLPAPGRSARRMPYLGGASIFPQRSATMPRGTCDFPVTHTSRS